MPVYVIRAGATEFVKIGWAVDPEARRQTLQCGHHEVLHLLRVIDGERRVECWLHRYFRSQHVRNEWFRFVPTMLTVTVAEITPEPPRAPKMSAESRKRLSRSLYLSWRDGRLRQTFEAQRQHAAERARAT